MGKGLRDVYPPSNSFLLLGVLRLCQFWWKYIKKRKRESARRRTHGQRQTGFIICFSLYAIAMGQITTWCINAYAKICRCPGIRINLKQNVACQISLCNGKRVYLIVQIGQIGSSIRRLCTTDRMTTSSYGICSLQWKTTYVIFQN